MAYVLQHRVVPPSAAVRRRLCPATGAASVVFVSALFLVYFCYVDDAVSGAGARYGQPSPLRRTTRYSLQQMREFAFKSAVMNHYRPPVQPRWNYSFSKIVEMPANRFDINASDVIVFIHIQKTAGTSFEKFLVRHTDLHRPCACRVGKKRCNCYRPRAGKEIWLFSRYSTGWACGLHADFTELFVSGCVEHAMDKREGRHRRRRYFYTTFLREPTERLVSEFGHVTRGANWLGARHVCNGRPPSPEQLPMCFSPEVGWEGVSLDEFLACPFNLGFNRQTRMLADLTLVNCYNRSSMDASTRDAILLDSAKNNLRNLAFFGLKERMNDSQFVFENLFGLKFTESLGVWNRSKSEHIRPTAGQLALIRERNELDIQLYRFAVRLFDKRLAMMRARANDAAGRTSNRPLGSHITTSGTTDRPTATIRSDGTTAIVMSLAIESTLSKSASNSTTSNTNEQQMR